MNNLSGTRINAAVFVEKSRTVPVFDVRTPAEFAQGHIPGAINLPLFSDDERVEIGTLYKQKGKELSVQRGLDFVGPKMRHLVEEAREAAGNVPVLVHCWRGGMRSEAMSWLLSFSGLPATVLEGGYKAFRHWVLSVVERPYDLRVIGGLTGSGKTEILNALAEKGAQTLDLEDLAHHKGSAFGGLGKPNQPTNEQFENEIAVILDQFDIEKSVWVEDESRLIGKLQVPKPLFENKIESPVYVINCSIEERLDRLVRDYGSFPKEQLAAKIEKIHDQLGGERCKLALEALEVNDFRTVARFMLEHYDRTYLNSLQKKQESIELVVECEGKTMEEIASELQASAANLER